jgi:hypothetical protein
MYMALHINNPEVEQRVRTVAARRGESVTQTIGAAVLELERRSAASSRKRPTVEAALNLIRSFPYGPVSYEKTEDEILGYGPNGYCE